MRTIAFIPIWLGLAAGTLAMPPPTLSYFDSFGQYSFGYSDPMAARSEYKLADGVTRGSYSFIDQNGMIQTTEYEAGKDMGFRVKATNLPEAPLPVQDTPEVKEAREKHLRLLDEALKREQQGGELLQAAERNNVPAELGIDPRNLNVDVHKAAGSVPAVASVIAPGTAPVGAPQVAPVVQQVAPGSIATSTTHSGISPVVAPTVAASEAAIPGGAPGVAPQNDLPIVEAKSSTTGIASRSAGVPVIPGIPSLPGVAPSVVPGIPSVPAVVPQVSARGSHTGAPGLAPTGTPGVAPEVAPALALPEPVKDTPEVMAAKAAHFRAYEAAAKLAAESDVNPQVLVQVLKQTQPVVDVKSAPVPQNINKDVSTKTLLPGLASIEDPKVRLGAIEKAAAAAAQINSAIAAQRIAMISAPQTSPVAAHEAAVQRIRTEAASQASSINANRIGTVPVSQASTVATHEAAAPRIGSVTGPQASPVTVQESSLVVAESRNINTVVEKSEIHGVAKSADPPKLGSGVTPASTSLLIQDTRLPSLNEFAQTKLKAGAYSTPIEISHIAPTNVLPMLYPTHLGSSAFQYIFL